MDRSLQFEIEHRRFSKRRCEQVIAVPSSYPLVINIPRALRTPDQLSYRVVEPTRAVPRFMLALRASRNRQNPCNRADSTLGNFNGLLKILAASWPLTTATTVLRRVGWTRGHHKTLPKYRIERQWNSKEVYRTLMELETSLSNLNATRNERTED